ncbi:MAG: ATP-binding protein [Candidatus Bathyarchaeota archaeon]
MATIGQTAGMVGHDMRNPLQTIVGILYLMMDDLNNLPESCEKKDFQELLNSVDESVIYINKIVADLQDYTRLIQLIFQEVDLQNLIENTLNLIVIPHNVKIFVNMDEGFSVRFDSDLMKRVFTTLITNAVQALPEGGSLTVNADKNENGITISFSDTGLGIPEDIKPKIFTPLFTTKSKGQGFGLAVCKRIVEAHNGEITFESEAG